MTASAKGAVPEARFGKTRDSFFAHRAGMQAGKGLLDAAAIYSDRNQYRISTI